MNVQAFYSTLARVMSERTETEIKAGSSHHRNEREMGTERM